MTTNNWKQIGARKWKKNNTLLAVREAFVKIKHEPIHSVYTVTTISKRGAADTRGVFDNGKEAMDYARRYMRLF